MASGEIPFSPYIEKFIVHLHAQTAILRTQSLNLRILSVFTGMQRELFFQCKCAGPRRDSRGPFHRAGGWRFNV